ncbi:rRNA maturation RNase YbeY [Fischerella thermalis CCMEE 5198]|uniref:rRNA maturation RNase YbeY n=1 Tax=Fischerella thermalis TaxID=372787 RepID=UPI000C8010CE|nr:rRNA maturation RNase YbeY [Fischerella thermalis]PLZ91633.1 rRNA maturation RNase YbeY [Fischerella thermalis CCMEE 5196]PMB27681.1 rRNA maturation RNase YbeY [Fischerella thermalis CCMEE 5198]
MQVEVYVQNYLSEYSQSESIKIEDIYIPITAQTWENWFNCWLEILQPSISSAANYEIGLRLTNDSEIQELNAQYRQQNKPTDVLSFAALEVDSPIPSEALASMPLYLGDIVISIDTAQQQAQKQGHTLLTELAWLASHGLLHLLGWDHPDEESLERMLKQQVKLLKSVGISIDIE